MIDAVRNLEVRTEALRKTINSLNTSQVRRKLERGAARSLVDDYFRGIREQLVIGGIEPDLIAGLDGTMHSLLDASHKHSAVSTYRSALKVILDALRTAEKLALSGSTSHASATEPIDARILETLARIVPPAARSYEQAIRDLSGPDRLSWRGPATDLRECLRETLDYLAPDEDVEAQPGFKLENDTHGPTMKQKVRYILSKRGRSKTSSKAAETSAAAIDEMVGAFVRSVYSRSSISTHTPTERDEILRIHTYVRACLCELLEVHVYVQG